MLINITGSSKLGLHEVNAACTLAREAAGNDDVQISFGVVLDEEMGDEVKVTVIATGFLRENLPRIERRSARVEQAIAAPVYQPPVVAERDPEPERAPEPAAAPEEPAPMTMAAAAAVNGAPTSTPVPSSTPAPSEPLFDDLEIPAILRSRRRGLVQ
jgi:cell division protein FtsZ